MNHHQNHTKSHDINVSDKTKLRSMFNFGHDLKLGQRGEDYVNDILQNDDVKVEVKTDDWATRSGNIGIEFESRGEPSGILSTEADFWCHIIGGYFVLMFPVHFLKLVYNTFGENERYVKSVGDRDTNGVPTSKVILIPWGELIGLFGKYNEKINSKRSIVASE